VLFRDCAATVGEAVDGSGKGRDVVNVVEGSRAAGLAAVGSWPIAADETWLRHPYLAAALAALERDDSAASKDR